MQSKSFFRERIHIPSKLAIRRCGFGVALSLTSAAFCLAAVAVFAPSETRGRQLT
jgi:hypothetical protein